jgi:hypothetical protein
MEKKSIEPNYESEERIIWLKDRETLAGMGWANEKIIVCSIRTGPIRPPKGEILVGYAVLKRDATKDSGEGFSRRIFTRPNEDNALCSELLDRCSKNSFISCDSFQEKAVDLQSVQPGKPSRNLFNPD